MAWIESHQELRNHPKVRRLARYLDVSIQEAIGCLHLLWWWALDYAPDGSLYNYDDDDIADAVLWTSGSENLVNALMCAGFIDEDRKIHDWYDYGGHDGMVPPI